MIENLIALANAPKEDNIVFHVSLRCTMVANSASTVYYKYHTPPHPVQFFTSKCKIFTSIIVMALRSAERVAQV